MQGKVSQIRASAQFLAPRGLDSRNPGVTRPRPYTYALETLEAQRRTPMVTRSYPYGCAPVPLRSRARTPGGTRTCSLTAKTPPRRPLFWVLWMRQQLELIFRHSRHQESRSELGSELRECRVDQLFASIMVKVKEDVSPKEENSPGR